MQLDMVVNLAMDVNLVMDVDLAMAVDLAVETDLAKNLNWMCTETCPWLLPWPWTWIAPDFSRIRFLIATSWGGQIYLKTLKVWLCAIFQNPKNACIVEI